MINNPKPLDKVINLNDIHYGLRNNSAEWLYNIDDIFFRKIIIPFIENLPDLDRWQMIINGDLHDSKQLFSVLIQNRIGFTIEKIAKLIPVWINTGNHDLYGDKPIEIDGQNYWINACRHLARIDNVHVIDAPHTINTISGDKVTIIPYIGTPNKHDINGEISIIEDIKSQHNDYLFTHTTYSGFFYEGKKIEGSEGISPELVKPFKKVFNGHIHSEQEKGNILITGSQYHTKTSEWKNPCHFHTIDFSAKKEVITVHENDLSPRYKETNILQLMDSSTFEAQMWCKNSYITVNVPTHLVGEFDYHPIYDLLSGARTVRFDPVVIEIGGGEQNLLGMEGISGMEGKIDVKSKYPDYLKELSIVHLDKGESIEITDKVKEKLDQSFAKLYEKAEQNLKLTDIEL